MRKMLNTAVLMMGLMVSGQAKATDASWLQLVQDVISAVANVATQAATESTATSTATTATQSTTTAAKTSISAAVDEWFQNTGFGQQMSKWKEIGDKSDSFITGARDVGGSLAGGGGTGIYKYKKEELPDWYTPSVICTTENSKDCHAYGPGYRGAESGSQSLTQRDILKVNPATINIANTIKHVSAAAAEKNAQELAVIQAMAQEAYAATNNRIALIEELQGKINNPDDASKDDAKYIANLQAQIQSQQALLGNEQNKLTALAILQQSQRDAYEQRKREIAAYVVGGGGGHHAWERALIAAVQKSAYSAVAASYKNE